MTRDNIIRMAREAGFPITNHLSGRQNIAGQSVARFERFAALVASAEREACAEIVEDMDVQHPKYIAASIRARGQA